MVKEIIKAATLLLSNTANVYLADYLRIFIRELKEDRVFDWGLLVILKGTVREKVDLTGWELLDLPGNNSYWFCKARGSQIGVEAHLIDGKILCCRQGKKLSLAQAFA